MEEIIKVKQLAEEYRERQIEKERGRRSAEASLLTPTEANRLTRYFEWVKDEKETERATFSDVCRDFYLSTGKRPELASDGVRNVIDTLQRNVGMNSKGFYLFGGTGCGKTTLARCFASYGCYRVVNCIDIAAGYSKNGEDGIIPYLSGSICLDDLGTEERAYGKEILSMVIQKRYERWEDAKRRVRTLEVELEGLKSYGKEKGFYSVDWDSLKASDDGFGEKMGWRRDVENMRDKIARMTRDIPVTHVTSNLMIDQHAERYGDRVSSRLFQMCYLVDMTGEPDYRG